MAEQQNALSLDPDKVNSLLQMEGRGELDPKFVPYVAELRKRGLLPPALPMNPITGTMDKPSLSGFGANLLSSAASNVGGMVRGVADIGTRLGSSLMSTEAPVNPIPVVKDFVAGIPQTARDMWSSVKERYGGITPALHTLYTDPVGAALDVSTVASLGELGTLKAAPSLSRTLGTVARATDPLSVVRVPKMPKLAESLMTKSIQPTEKVLTRDPDIIKKALQYGVGVDKAAENEARIKAVVDNIYQRTGDVEAAGGAPISSRNVVTHPRVQEERRAAKMQVAPTEDKAAVKSTVRDFYESHGSEPTTKTVSVPQFYGPPVQKTVTSSTFSDIPLSEGREIAAGTYRKREPAYDAPAAWRTKAETEKALAAGIVDEIAKSEEDLVAQGKLPNAVLRQAGTESMDRIRLQQAIQRRLHETATARGIPMQAAQTAGAATVAAIFHHPIVAGAIGGTGAARIILEDPRVQSALARVFYRGGRILPRATSTISNISRRISDALPPPPEEKPKEQP